MASQNIKKDAKSITKARKTYQKKINKLKSEFESNLKINSRSKGLYLKNKKDLFVSR